MNFRNPRIAGWEPVTPENPYQYMSLDVPHQFLPYYIVKGDMLWNKIAPIIRNENGGIVHYPKNAVLVMIVSMFVVASSTILSH